MGESATAALANLSRKRTKLAIGLMSGTSADGIDAALVQIRNHGLQTRVELREFLMVPYSQGLRQAVLDVAQPGGGDTATLCRLNVVLGEAFAGAALALLERAGLQAPAVDFIGSHGQTVQHLPNDEDFLGHRIRSTLQLGEPSVIAKRTGILTVADFRPADMAVGGQGAPLVCYFDYLLFRSPEQARALLNIGGIANFTAMPREASLEELIAFDCGPGNMVVDALMQRLFRQPFDRDGAVAARGRVSERLLEWALSHAYFKLQPPKTTGRETFGADFVDAFWRRAQDLELTPEDAVTTATELTARSIWMSYCDHVQERIAVDEFVVSGGGAENAELMRRLSMLANPLPVRKIDEFGLSSEAKEAVCFAVLANETLAGQPANVPAATGASRATILGKICF